MMLQISFVDNHDQLLSGSDRTNYVTVYNEGFYSLALQVRAHVSVGCQGRRASSTCPTWR